MGLTNPTFLWSLPSFAMGLVLILNVSTFRTAMELWFKARSQFYAVLAFIAVTHVIDFFLGNWSQTFEDDTGPSSSSVAPGARLALKILSIFCAMCNGTGFTLLNISSFYKIGATRRPVLTKVLVALAGASVLLCVVNNVTYVVSYVIAANTGDKSLSMAMDETFNAWSIYDSILNLLISLSFIALLRRMGGTSAGGTMRRGFNELLTSVSWTLGIECTLVIAANILVRAAPDLDPQWAFVYVSEAARLRLFCIFLVSLNQMLRADYPRIDADPHASRVVRFMRPSDLALWAGAAAAAPAAYYAVDIKQPAGNLAIGLRGAGAIGVIGGFLLAYQRSSFRFWGLEENAREVEKDRAEYAAARAEGKPHHLGESDLEGYLQSVSARHSRYSALKFSWLPWFNFVHHNQGVNWDLYKDLNTAESA
ncbi:hypothetical protein H9P43_000301 [Blastocladiella emersonii ATCC 22665]|nr:hypothetical protein H9P43_000301 [Blastocladiella emersonii ATCC 22665]